MLGALSLKWKWRERREAAKKGTDRPNLVFGGDVHVVWEKFCRYFDVEPRIVPLAPDKYTIGPEDVAARTSTRTRSASPPCWARRSPGTPTTSAGSTTMLVALKHDQGLDVPLHVDAASGGFVWPFLYPDTEWDFRLEQVRSINVSGHKFGLVYPGIGWLVFREESDLARGSRVLRELPRQARRDLHAELLHRLGDGARAVLQLRAPRPLGLPLRHGDDEVQRPRARGGDRRVRVRDHRRGGRGAAPARRLQTAGEHAYDEFDVAAQLAAERGWMVPAYTLPPNAEHVKIMRALVKQTLSYSMTVTLGAGHRRSLRHARQEGRPAPGRPASA